jgi:hypothetical protein
VTIEDLDEPNASRSGAPAFHHKLGRLRLLTATAGILLGVTVGAALLVPDGFTQGTAAPTQGAPSGSVPDRTTAASGAVCEPTTRRDASGVITTNDAVGIIGDTFTPSRGAEQVGFLIVRRGAVAGDNMGLRFTQVGTTTRYSPLTGEVMEAPWIAYSVPAATQKTPTPWGDPVAFPAWWKPIAGPGSCWRLIVDGSDTGLVLAVGP